VRFLLPWITTRHVTTLRWRVATDNVAVTRYLVYRSVNGVWKFAGSTPAKARAFTIARLTPGRSYSFRVRARDAAGNLGPLSATVRVRTRH
jgi:hypothetical protein